MTEIKVFPGRKGDWCPHCDIWAAADHPGYSCPRIRYVHFDENQNPVGVEYIDPSDWEHYLMTFHADE